jgi:NADH dehydrogenase
MATLPGGAAAASAHGARYELAGPETLTYRQIVEIALGSFHRRRRVVPIPTRIVRRSLQALELVMGPAAFATWDEAQLLDIAMTSRRGIADAEQLGVRPRAMRAVLGVG